MKLPRVQVHSLESCDGGNPKVRMRNALVGDRLS